MGNEISKLANVTKQARLARLALAHLTLEELAPEDVVTVAAQAGFRSVALRITGFAPDEDPVGLAGDSKAQLRLARRLVDEGVRLVSICSYRLTDVIEAAAYRPIIEACVAIGAPTLLITCFALDEARRTDTLAAMAEEAQSGGVAIGLEFYRSSALKLLHEAEDLRRKASRDNIGHVIDALHLARAGNVPKDLAHIPSKAIFGVQLCDAPIVSPPESELRNEIRNRLLPGDGELPLAALLAAVPSSIAVEIETPEPGRQRFTPLERARRAFHSGLKILSGRELSGSRTIEATQ